MLRLQRTGRFLASKMGPQADPQVLVFQPPQGSPLRCIVSVHLYDALPIPRPGGVLLIKTNQFKALGSGAHGCGVFRVVVVPAVVGEVRSSSFYPGADTLGPPPRTEPRFTRTRYACYECRLFHSMCQCAPASCLLLCYGRLIVTA